MTTVDDAALAAFQQSIRGPIVLPGDANYDSVRAIWNGLMHDRRPAMIVQCTGPADVIDTVNLAREHGLLLTVRGGGHHVAGNSVRDDAIMLDLSLMKGIFVDSKGCTVRAQGGVTWGDLDRETQVFGLAAPGGVVSTTGIGGLTLGGGMGHLRRKYGLACDNLVSVDIVTADGQLRHASADENPDLFWAVRGGGGNFGVVTTFEFRLHPVGPEIMMCQVVYPVSEAKKVLSAWRDFMDKAPDEISSLAFFWGIPALDVLPVELHKQPVVGIMALHCGTADEGERAMQPLREISTPLLDFSAKMPYRLAQAANDPFYPKGGRYYYNKCTELATLDDEVLDALICRGLENPTAESILALWDYTGAVSRVGVTDTAFSGRGPRCLFSVDTGWNDPADTERIIAWSRDFVKSLEPYSVGGHYVNFTSDPESTKTAYGPNYARLVEVKNRYDPGNLFRINHNIKPTG